MTNYFGSRVKIRCTNPDGLLAWEHEDHNITPNEGLNNFLSILFKATSPPATWYVLLVNNAGFTAFAAGDTAAQIGGANGWAEFTNYSESTRVAVVWGSVASESVDNSASQAVFSITAPGTLKGIALVTASAKSATSGFIGGEVAFAGGTLAVINGSVVTVTVTEAAASS